MNCHKLLKMISKLFKIRRCSVLLALTQPRGRDGNFAQISEIPLASIGGEAGRRHVRFFFCTGSFEVPPPRFSSQSYSREAHAEAQLPCDGVVDFAFAFQLFKIP
jgi:hypothetical protein